MAGSLYLGSQRVCPAVVSGNSEPTTCVFRVSDDVTEISKNQAFYGIYGNVYPFPYDIAIDFNNLGIVSGKNCFCNSFCGCKIVSLKDNIKTVSGEDAFNVCFAISDIPEESTIFENLESISVKDGLQCCFAYSKGKQTYRFKKLNVIADRGLDLCFMGSSAVKHIYFDSLTENSFDLSEDRYNIVDMVMGVTGCTLHFPSNLSSVIPTLYGYPSFGGTNTVILYDLPATN